MQRIIHNGITFQRTAKNVALRRIAANGALKFFIVGCNVNARNFFHNWMLASSVMTREHLDNEYCKVQDFYNSFAFYLEPELGRYPIFYIEATK